MSTPDSTPVPANLEQQHKLAKDLIQAARDGDPAALARIRAVRSDAGESSRPLALADAQLAVAREAGFPSWPKLVADFQERDVKAFCAAVRGKDIPRTQQLVALDHVRARINDPMFDFGQRAAHAAAKNVTLLEVLIGAGADVNLRSDWQNGPYTVLDNTDEDTARWLMRTGRDADAERRRATRVAGRSAAARRCRSRAGARPRRRRSAAAARGEDGRRSPTGCSTAAPGSTCPASITSPRRRSTRSPIGPTSAGACSSAAPRPTSSWPPASGTSRSRRACSTPIRTAPPPASTSPATRRCRPSTSTAGRSGSACRRTPWRRGSDIEDVHALLASRSPARVRFLDALLAADEPAAKAVIAEDPSLLPSLTPHEHGHLAHAIFHELFDAADLMLRLGFDPSGPGIDGGTALHAACWVGSVRMVDRLLAHGGVPLDARDPTHQSTLLGWAAFGSVHRRAPGADYPAVAERLVAAGADITAVGNGGGKTLLEMATGNATMQAALRRLGAT